MNEILLNIISVIVTAVVIPLITWTGSELIRWLNTKTKNAKAEEYIRTATDIITNAVRTVFQTYVDSLKKSGSFNEGAQRIALLKAKGIILEQMSDGVREFISANYGDFDNWLETRIESSIDKLRNS